MVAVLCLLATFVAALGIDADGNNHPLGLM
jgi:transposase-like protein